MSFGQQNRSAMSLIVCGKLPYWAYGGFHKLIWLLSKSLLFHS